AVFQFPRCRIRARSRRARFRAGTPSAFGGDVMITKRAGLAFGLALFGGVACAAEGPSPEGVPSLKHVFLIMMENHGFSQIFNNPNAPFTNSLAKTANLATNYFAVAHPSL